ncbi:methyl-accepting chemotaxis protein [Asticcacaulis excentricus]|uniref:Methyl-accepting chemotaxis protein n=1 Tax=Asticcacaulis excentricus TaxID=78587 RepID=A0A3G9FZE8_9CAUL|nr:methyl-accepting chemotaxis protein [Asticcacaulis excentricus]BBF79726.1 methyl-accepting chemotaxis protein [Asticcacaulis excentricus]
MDALSTISASGTQTAVSNEAVSVNDIIACTARARGLTQHKVRDIRQVTNTLRILALNALIEARRAGELGAGFGVVADEVRNISTQVEGLSSSLASELGGEIEALEKLTRDMARQAQGARLTDLALNAIELIDRNLYERTCDVRWWATDSAVWEAASHPTKDNCHYASSRLGVILDAYTVYIDLWLCDLNGHILANGRPDRFSVTGQNVASRDWYQKALSLSSGNDFAVADITTEPLLKGAQVASYATGVRVGGQADGELIGILGVHFDWQPQAETIVKGVRLTEAEKRCTRVLLTDAQGLVIAASDGRGSLNERIPLDTQGRTSGHYMDRHERLVAFHRTPGYETYHGLGWYGVIVQEG